MARIRRYLGRVELWLDKRERAALAHAVDELRREVAPATVGEGGGRQRRHVYDDPRLQAEFQRYTAPDVGEVVRADVEAVRSDLAGKTEPLRLDDDRALLWLRALNHLRLVAGDRLGIEDDGWEEASVEELSGNEGWAMLMDLGWIQEGIITALE